MSFRQILSRAILIALPLLLAVPAFAAVIERDFVTGSGDGLLTYDDVNQREWLDFTVFAAAWSSDEAFFDAWTNPDFNFVNEFGELGPGGIYSEFRLARIDDVDALAASAGIDVVNNDIETNRQIMSELTDLVGPTFTFPGSSTRLAIGFIDHFAPHPFPPSPRRYTVTIRSSNSRPGFVNDSDFSEPQFVGLALYRNVIPEPSSLLIVLVCAFVAAVKRCSRPLEVGGWNNWDRNGDRNGDRSSY